MIRVLEDTSKQLKQMKLLNLSRTRMILSLDHVKNLQLNESIVIMCRTYLQQWTSHTHSFESNNIIII